MTRLSGLVAAIDSGSPVVDARVTVDGTSRGTRTTVRGSYFLDAVDVGRGWRTVRAEKEIAGQTWTGERAVLFDANITVQSNLLVVIGPASRKGTVRGRVTTAGGAPLRNISVFLNPETTVAAAFRITDSGGRYEFRGVPAGTYTVVASARDLVNSGASQVVIAPSSTETVDLSMLLSTGSDVPAPTGLAATAFTYPDAARADLAQVRAVQRWLETRRGRGRSKRPAGQFRVQNWPVGSIIEVSLDWTPPSATDLAGYVLDRAVGGGSFGTIDRFADPTATAYYDLDPIYTPDLTYQFRISAVNSSGLQSPASNTATARPLEPFGALSPEAAAVVGATPTFAWQAVPRAQRYQVLVLSRPPELSDASRMPLVWPPADNLVAAQTASTQLAYAGPPLQPGSTYYWMVFAFDGPDPAVAPAVSAGPVRSFTVQ